MPQPENTTEPYTWNTPTIVENVTEDANGMLSFSVRVGKTLLLQARHERTFSDEKPPSDEAIVFRIKPANRIGLSENVSIQALTDAVKTASIFWQPTVPTASQYRAAIGSERLIDSQTRPNPDRSPAAPKFTTNRVFITIP